MNSAPEKKPQYGTFGGGGGVRDLESQLPHHNLAHHHHHHHHHGHGGGKSATDDPLSSSETLKLAGLFGLWYFLNVMYNIDNKNALVMLPLPWTVSVIQLFTGWIFFCTAWLTGLRKVPSCRSWEIFSIQIVPQGIFHLMVHIGAVISIGAGAVSFTHIVKAGEPVMTAGLSGILMKQIFSWQTYLSLIPIVFGVGLASLKELSFTWMSFTCAMISNLGSSLRSIYAKKVMSDPKEVGENFTSANLYSMLTIVASITAVPLALIMEGPVLRTAWEEATELNTGRSILLKVVLSGIWYYLYNEVAFGALERVHQVTHAVANTLKRVVIIVATVFVFQNPITMLGAIGSAVAIGGTLCYSLAKAKFG